MTTIHRLGERRFVTTVKGAPETVLLRCGVERTNTLNDRAGKLMLQGYRVIPVGEIVGEDVASALVNIGDSGGMCLVGFVAFGDAVRPSAVVAVCAARAFGARVVMVTGDNPVTARTVAASVGMDTEPTVTGQDLVGLSTERRVEPLASSEPSHNRFVPADWKPVRDFWVGLGLRLLRRFSA